MQKISENPEVYHFGIPLSNIGKWHEIWVPTEVGMFEHLRDVD
jgi:hypothetical protein